jgi:hypothetical protein
MFEVHVHAADTAILHLEDVILQLEEGQQAAAQDGLAVEADADAACANLRVKQSFKGVVVTPTTSCVSSFSRMSHPHHG